MAHLKLCFNSACDQKSPIVQDYDRVVNVDEDGNEVVIYLPVDANKIRESNGSVKDWSLDALLKAGINPNFPIRTGLNTRLEGVDVVNDAVASLDEILGSETKSDE